MLLTNKAVRHSLNKQFVKAIQALILSMMMVTAAFAQGWKVNFNDADIQELIRFVADATGKTIVIDPKISGKIKVMSNRELNEQELYELFLSILDVHGFSALDNNGIIRIIPSRSARSLPTKFAQSPDNSDEFVTHVIHLENIDASKLIPLLRPLVPQQAHMAAYAPSNSIIISDISSNITKIRSIIEQIDLSATQETEIIMLKHASAEEVVRLLQQLEKPTTQAAQGAVQKSTKMVADKRTNSVLVSADRAERKRIRDMIHYLDTPLDRGGNARVVYLHYADAKETATVLNKVIQGVEKLEGDQAAGAQAVRGAASVEADESTNSLVITAPADVMQTLESVIAQLDIRRAQVLVEAIIVEIEDNALEDLGVEWAFIDRDHGFGSSTAGDGGLANFAAGALQDDSDPEESIGLLGRALANSSGVNLGIADYNADGISFIAKLNALEDNGLANILSTPSLLTLDNNEANISVGQEVPFVTGSFTNSNSDANNPFQTIERKSVGVSLQVTPHINEGDMVVLDIVQEVSSVNPSIEASDVVTNERKLETSVLVRDGDTIVLGGLIKEESTEIVTRVPFLGSLPFIGKLFRNKNTKVGKQNLMIFIKPTVMRDGETLLGATAEKYSYIRQQQENYRETTLIRGAELPLLPEWEEQLKSLKEVPVESEEPSAGKEPSAKEESSAGKEPSTKEKPSAEQQSSAEQSSADTSLESQVQ